VKYRFRAAKSFRHSLARLSAGQRQTAKAAFEIFKQDPFDPRLRAHKIHKLSAIYGKTVYAVCIEGDLRAVFYVEGNTVWSVDIGSHAIYRGG
jgi:mRNA-degrading endonuclease YafQ of YafQ-DinJ toxin-antitoxin module